MRTSSSSPTGAPGTRVPEDGFVTRSGTTAQAHAVRLLQAHYDTRRSGLRPGRLVATGNWEHFPNEEGAALLKQFKGTLDPAKQKAIAYRLQSIFLDDYAVHSAVHRPALVDLQHEVLRRLGHVEERSTSTRSLNPTAGRADPAVAQPRVKDRGVTTTSSNRPSGSAGAGQPADPKSSWAVVRQGCRVCLCLAAERRGTEVQQCDSFFGGSRST